MFSENKKFKPMGSDHTKEQNKIAQGTKINGDITAKGGLRLEGTVEGTVTTPGKIVVGKTGFVDGKIACEQADFEGKFSGNLNVKETLTLRSTALIEGEVATGKLAVEPGATFNATCNMKGGVKSLKEDSSGNEQKKKPHEERQTRTLGA